MEQNSRTTYSFGRFLLDPSEHLLFSQGKPVALTPKAFETLVVLVERNGRLVTKEELLQQIWPNAFVEEATLAKNIFTVRKALGEKADKPAFIETVPKMGYRFIASVDKQESNGSAPMKNATSAKTPEVAQNGAPVSAPLPALAPALAPIPPLAPIPSQTPARPKNWWRAAVPGLLVAILGCYLLLHRINRVSHSNASVPHRIQSLAVLPLANLSGDTSQDYFADGMTDELITVLTELHSVQVTSRTSTTRYRNTSKPLSQIAQELHVDAIVEGAVVRSGDRVRVTVQLIEGATDRHIWAASYDRPVMDALAIQADIAREVARQIQLEITPAEEAHLRQINRPLDPQVEEEYLLGRYYWNKRNANDLKQAIGHFEKAISLDPHYAPAHAGLADSYLVLMLVSNYSGREAVVRAKAAAQEALRLDDSLGEAHTSLAYARQYDWDFNGAEREYQRALELSPGYATAHQWYGEFLSYMNRPDEALEQYRAAMQLDPLSPVIHMEAALPYFYMGQLDEALQKLRDAMQIDPNFGVTHAQIARILEAQGKHQQALAELQQAEKFGLADTPWIVESYGIVYTRMGDRQRAQICLARLLSLAKRSDASIPFVAWLLVVLGKNDQAMEWYQRAYREHNYALIGFGAYGQDPDVKKLLQDPRFAAIFRGIGYPPSVTNALQPEPSFTKAKRNQAQIHPLPKKT